MLTAAVSRISVARAFALRLKARLPRKLMRAVGIAVALGLIVVLLVGNRRMVVDGFAALPNARPELLLSVVALQVLSLTAYALMVRRLLGLADVHLSLPSLLGMTLAGVAINNSVPGGQASSTVYWYKRLHQEGAAGPLAALILSLAAVTGVLTLLVLAAIGLAVDQGHGLLAPLRWPLVGAAGLLVVAGTLGRARLAKGLRSAANGAGATDQMALNRSTHPRDITALLLLSVANWLTDVLSLIVALSALGISVPWPAVLLVYTCAQIVSSIPLLPGGGGTVEATLAVGIGAAGHASARLVAGVILYRLISAWGQVPLGWLIWMRSAKDHRVGADAPQNAGERPPRRRLRQSGARRKAAPGTTRKPSLSDCRGSERQRLSG